MKYGLVEFSSDLTPLIIIGNEWEEVDREAVRQIRQIYGPFIEDENTGRNFLVPWPYPDDSCDSAKLVAEWLEQLRDATTMPFYTRLETTNTIMAT